MHQSSDTTGAAEDPVGAPNPPVPPADAPAGDGPKVSEAAARESSGAAPREVPGAPSPDTGPAAAAPAKPAAGKAAAPAEPDAGDTTAAAEAAAGDATTTTEPPADEPAATTDLPTGDTAAATKAAAAEEGVAEEATEKTGAEETAAEETGTEEAASTGADEAAGADGSPATPRSRGAVLRALRARVGRDARRRWRARHPLAARITGIAVTVVAVALVVVALVMPNRQENFRLAQFTRLPVEALLGAAVLIALPRRPRLAAAVLGGLALGALTVLNVLDIGFYEYLGRGFNVILDWQLLDDAQSYVADTMGGTYAFLAAAGAILLALLVVAVMALAVVRIGTLLGRNRTRSTHVLLVLSALWMTCATLNLDVSGVPLAAEHTVTMVKYREARVRETIRDERAFAKEARRDAFGATPGSQLVPALRGKDMVFAFIESYGRSAVEDPIMAPGVDAVLDARTKALAKAGFHAKSGWLTSATYGGSSWLGHSTFMSGMWINNQNRYRTVTADGEHLTLTKAFRKTGAWDTVGVMPGVQKGWPEAKWYGLDKVYNAFQLGYKGPKFSWSTMPDQYALEQFQRREHSRKRDKPLMSFLILTSSHQPWAPIPRMVGWDRLGDGSVFKAIEKAGNKPADIIASPTRSREEYGKSIQYSVTALTQWLERYGRDDTVLVFLGDHQPISRVSGTHASRDVPCTIVAKDPKVLDRIAGWGWTDGLRPAHDAPVWKMSSFRDRFLKAYGSTPHPTGN
ncbi:CDP-alcohol phosphatidyltransferase [Streptomyces echinoruber]